MCSPFVLKHWCNQENQLQRGTNHYVYRDAFRGNAIYICVARWHCSHKHNDSQLSWIFKLHTRAHTQTYTHTYIIAPEPKPQPTCFCFAPQSRSRSKTQSPHCFLFSRRKVVHFNLMQQAIKQLSQVCFSVSCLYPEQQNRWDEDFDRQWVLFNLTACAPEGVCWRPAHVRVTTWILSLRKVPPCGRSASCKRSSMAEHIDALLGSCCTAEWDEKEKEGTKTFCAWRELFFGEMLQWKWWTVRWTGPYIADIARWWPVVWLFICQSSVFTRKQVIPLFLPEAFVYRHNVALCGEDVLVIRFVKWVVLIKQLQWKLFPFWYFWLVTTLE